MGEGVGGLANEKGERHLPIVGLLDVLKLGAAHNDVIWHLHNTTQRGEREIDDLLVAGALQVTHAAHGRSDPVQIDW